MIESDVDALLEISNSDAVYKYISPFLFHKSEKFLKTAINNFGARDFDKKKMIIAGIYLQETSKLVGSVEIFIYKKRSKSVTIGYRINENYWHQGIASSAIQLMVKYLFETEIETIYAYVMSANKYSAKALLRNGFRRESYNVQEKNWGGQEIVDLEVYLLKKENRIRIKE